MKKYLTTILVIILILTASAIPAFATNVDAIKPDYPLPTMIVFPEVRNVIIYPDGSYMHIVPFRQEAEIAQEVTPTYTPIEEEVEVTPAPTPTPAEEPQPDYEELIKDIFALVNQARMDNELEPLTYNNKLQSAAELRAQESSLSFSHTRPDGTSFASAIDLDYEGSGENLIMADNEISDAEILMDTWMNSAGHRANILSKDFTQIAIGVYRSNGVTYVAQLFLKP